MKRDRKTSAPTWYQVKNSLLEDIEKAEVGDRLDSSKTLTKRFGVSLAPVTRAISELQREGYLSPGAGARPTIVSKIASVLPKSTFLNSLMPADSEVVHADVRIVASDEDAATLEAGAQLKLEAQAEFVLVSRVRVRPMARDRLGVVWDRAYLPASAYPASVLKLDFANPAVRIHDLHAAAGFQPATQEWTATADLATAEEEDMLRLAKKAFKDVTPGQRLAVARCRQTSCSLVKNLVRGPKGEATRRLVPFEFWIGVFWNWTWKAQRG